MRWKIRLGEFLFKWRSFTQLPWIIIVLVFLKPFYPSFSLNLEPFITISGILITLLGEILRIWAHLYAGPRTSGRENYLIAESLNREGPYRFVRNPLYLGNFLIVGGLLIVFSNLIAFIIGISFLFFQYSFIVLAEENYLKNRFGKDWIDYRSHVPRFLPKIKNLKFSKDERKNSLLKVLVKEQDTIFNIITVFFVIYLLKLNSLSALGEREIFYSLFFYSPFILFYILLKIIKVKA